MTVSSRSTIGWAEFWPLSPPKSSERASPFHRSRSCSRVVVAAELIPASLERHFGSLAGRGGGPGDAEMPDLLRSGIHPTNAKSETDWWSDLAYRSSAAR